MRIVYYSYGEHDFSFYTDMNVNRINILGLEELYRKRWRIENGYHERKIDIRERTHPTRMKLRYSLYLFSILVYNLWLPVNLIRKLYELLHIIFLDFLIASEKGNGKQ